MTVIMMYILMKAFVIEMMMSMTVTIMISMLITTMIISIVNIHSNLFNILWIMTFNEAYII